MQWELGMEHSIVHHTAMLFSLCYFSVFKCYCFNFRYLINVCYDLILVQRGGSGEDRIVGTDSQRR